VPPAPVRVPGQRSLAPNVTSDTSVANDKGDNEMMPGAVHRSPGIYLTAKENPGNEGAVQPVIASNVVPYFQMTSVGSHSSSECWEGRKEGKDYVLVLESILT
jgi:hypothetical protein